MDIIRATVPSSVIYTVAITTAIAIVLTYLHVSKYKHWKRQNVRGPNQWPIIGNLDQIFFSKSMLMAMERRWNNYGPVYGMYMFSLPQLVVGDPDMIKDIFVRDWHVFADRVAGRKTGDPTADNFLVNLSGNDWKRMRNVTSPTFTSGKMKHMFNIMNDCCQLMVNNINQKIKSSSIGQYELDVKHLSGCYSMDVIAKCCFATDTNSFNDPDQVFVTVAKRFFSVTKTRIFIFIIFTLMPMFVKKMFGFKGMDRESTEFFENVSKEILKQRRKEVNFKGPKDYLQLLVEASKDVQKTNNAKDDATDIVDKVADNESHHGYEDINQNLDTTNVSSDLKRPLTDEEIISNTVLFLAVGYDTTGSLITFATYLLAINEEKQNILYEEIKNAHENNGNQFNYETISAMKYLDAVISETLRIYPPAPLIERRAMEDYKFAKNGIEVPNKASIIIPIWNIHHDAKFWPEPLNFEPERFLPENRHKIIPYTYVPFGGGPRNCVGMRFALLEAKMAIANLILNFKFATCTKTEIPIDLSPTVGLLNPKNIFVGVETRN